MRRAANYHDMGCLTRYLQQTFGSHCPPGWECEAEVRVLSPEFEKLAGYAPRADVLLRSPNRGRNLWIEFEVSRADPVANHAKFAVGHLLAPQAPTDVFVAMVSPHVARGRRGLAAHAVALLRHLGMNAFQTVLLPQLSGDSIKQLNHTSLSAIADAGLPIGAEVARALCVTEPVGTCGGHQIHFAPDIVDVVENVRQWNVEMSDEKARLMWGRRTVTFLVYDAPSKSFAPAKFCAFVPAPTRGRRDGPPTIRQLLPRMSIALYASLDGAESRFDGARARKHLTDGLAMRAQALADVPALQPVFAAWYQGCCDVVALHPQGPVVLSPPQWYG